MSDVLERSLAFISEQNAIPILARVYDGKDYASLDSDWRALSGILFVAGVSEFLHNYSQFKLVGTAAPPVQSDLFKRFEAEIIEGLRYQDLNILDVGLSDQIRFIGFFNNYLSSIYAETGLAASNESLRVSVVEFFRENPSIFKIIAAGASSAMLSLALVLGGVGIAQQSESPKCRAEATEYARAQSTLIARQFRLEGKMTEVHRQALKDVENSHTAAIAACQARLPGVHFKGSARGIEIDFGADYKLQAQEE